MQQCCATPASPRARGAPGPPQTRRRRRAASRRRLRRRVRARTPAPPLPFPSPARPRGGAAPPVARPAVPAAPGPAAVAAVAGLDGLVAEMVHLSRPALAARPVRVEVRMTPGTPLPRCSPIGLKRSFAALFQGLSAVVAPQSAIVVRAEKKPVLLQGQGRLPADARFPDDRGDPRRRSRGRRSAARAAGRRRRPARRGPAARTGDGRLHPLRAAARRRARDAHLPAGFLKRGCCAAPPSPAVSDRPRRGRKPGPSPARARRSRARA